MCHVPGAASRARSQLPPNSRFRCGCRVCDVWMQEELSTFLFSLGGFSSLNMFPSLVTGLSLAKNPPLYHLDSSPSLSSSSLSMNPNNPPFFFLLPSPPSSSELSPNKPILSDPGGGCCSSMLSCRVVLALVLLTLCLSTVSSSSSRVKVNKDTHLFVGPDGRHRIFHGVNAVQKSFPWHPMTSGVALSRL